MLKRFENTKKFMLTTVFCNSRLKTYARYIAYAKEQGYRICSMKEFWDDKDSSNKHFVLRHDVDHISKATRKMFEVELRECVHSTYYFRWSTINEELIKDMLSAGFEVGLHYETIATYARKNTIKKKKTFLL